jgi:8-amino-7-oxononanoate synthase
VSWSRLVGERDRELTALQRKRTVIPLDGAGPELRVDGGRGVVSFASNDYLGLSQHPDVKAAAVAAVERWGTGAGASRLVVGDRPPHRALEEALADWKHADAALVLPTGYAANLAVLTALGSTDVLICSDELNHASIVDGCRLARARTAVFRHRDVEHAAALVGSHPGPAIVVTDAVFSMDGDVAPVADLCALCRSTGALLVLDEAHAVLGPEPDLEGVDAIRVGTLSKTLGGIGGFVSGPRPFVDLLVSTARPFIFTTAPAPADAAAALAALGVLRSADGAALLARLRAHVDTIAPGHPSPIVPVILGSEAAALEASGRLLDDGFLVPAIRPPTVAPGTSRLRVTLSAAHTDDQVERLAKALSQL